RGFCRIVGPVSDRLQRLQLDHWATQSRRLVLFSMGARHPIRSFHDSPLHVDRPLLCRSAVPLSNGSGAASLFTAGRSRNSHCRHLLFAFPVTLCFPAPSCQRMARRNLWLVLVNGFAFQSPSVLVSRPAVA